MASESFVNGPTTTEPTPIAPMAVRRRMIEERSLGAGNFLDWAVRLNPNHSVPLIFKHSFDAHGHVILTAYSLDDLVAIRDRYAAWYHANGVGKGDVVGIYVSEGVEPMFQFLALSALGAIAALINNGMAVAPACGYLQLVGAVGLVCDDPTAFKATFRNNPNYRPRFISAVSELHAYQGGERVLPSPFPVSHADDDIVALVHSSGTTGIPKPTMAGHKQFWIGKEQRLIRLPAEPYDRLMSVVPHTHAGGLSYFLTAVLMGLPMIAMSDWRRTVVEPVMKVFKPTMVLSFPRTFVELSTDPLPTEACSSVHTWINMGDSAHYGHIRRLVTMGRRPSGLIRPALLADGEASAAVQPGSQFIDGFGSSELGMSLFGGYFTMETERNDRCIGSPIGVVEHAIIVNEAGEEQPVGTPGLLALKAPTITPGYWNDPEMSKRFRLSGYWLTGDVARRDEDGRFYHLDRTVDVIDGPFGAVYSLPIEEMLLADFAAIVLDCSVVGVPSHNRFGQRPIAIIRPQRDATIPTEGQLLTLFNEHLSKVGLEQLAAVQVARRPEDFPVGVTGKVLKRELRTRFATLLEPATI
ncbi:acyl-coenzyme A synthetase/AMP-(fatty) acid ligase [Bradyrhizobium algeriense]|uniref:Acyl-coenzyme A synthetase/AMP-(Fatty) acid ligase n=2 Tax=Bradyrhizobium algeriense TaxID=634784 RepID=A0ABU8BHL9_9BRAD